jgi:hypothetical protein
LRERTKGEGTLYTLRSKCVWNQPPKSILVILAEAENQFSIVVASPPKADVAIRHRNVVLSPIFNGMNASIPIYLTLTHQGRTFRMNASSISLRLKED